MRSFCWFDNFDSKLCHESCGDFRDYHQKLMINQTKSLFKAATYCFSLA